MNPTTLARVERVEPRPLLLAAGGLLVLALLAAWFYWLGPPLGEYRALLAQRELDAARSQAGVAAAPDAVSDLEARVVALEQLLDAGRDGASANEVMADIIGTLDRLAGRFGVQLSGVRPGQPAEVATFVEQPFDIEASGGYFQLIGWLRAAEVELRPMLVKSFDFRAGGDPAQGVSVDLRVVSYRVPPETP